MDRLRSLRDYQIGQFGHIGSLSSSQVLHEINKFSVKNLNVFLDKDGGHATQDIDRNTLNSGKIFQVPGLHNKPNNSAPRSQSTVHKDGNHSIDSMTVPVIVPCASPYSSQYGYGRKVFPCPQCRYTTDRRNNLKRHMLTMHQTCSKTLECCGILFATKASLREHAMIFHYHGYTCFYCGRRFCRKALLKRHLSVHNGQKDYVCPVCDYATSHKSNLERHRKVHCRPDDKKEVEGICGPGEEQYEQWVNEGSSAFNRNIIRNITEESDDEDEEINVDSD